MAQDWKDMLASLRGDEPQEREAEPNDTDGDINPDACKNKVQQKLHVVVERKGRKGKTATIIEGFTLSDEEVESIASELKRKIGTGGSARGGEILLQGEWKDKVSELLREKGYKC